KVATSPANHMTRGALSLTEEDCFAGLDVTGNRQADCRRIEASNKSGELTNLFVRQGECRHRGPFYAVFDETEQFRILCAPNFPTCCKIGPLPLPLTAFAASAVTTSAILPEEVSACFHQARIS